MTRPLKHFNRSIRLAPYNALSYMDRGWAWSCKAEHDKALADFDRAIQLDPYLVSVYNYRECLDEEKAIQQSH